MSQIRGEQIQSGTVGATQLTTAVQNILTKADNLPAANGVSFKNPVRVAADSNLSLSGTPTVDGVALSSGERILLTAQTAPAQNGIWVVGTWVRPPDYIAGTDSSGVLVLVNEGTLYGDTKWVCTSDAGSAVVDTDSLTFAQDSTGGASVTAGDGLVLTGSDLNVVANADGSVVVNANDLQVGVLASDAQHGVRGGGTQHAVATTSVAGFLSGADKTKLDSVASSATAIIPRQEVLAAETITGTDTALAATLSNTPVSNASVRLFLNGLAQRQGATFDYTVSGTTITWLASSGTAIDITAADLIEVDYASAS